MPSAQLSALSGSFTWCSYSLASSKPNLRIVHFGREGFEMRERLRAVTAGLGDFTVRAARLGPCAALERDARGAFCFVEGAGALECAREPHQILLVE